MGEPIAITPLGLAGAAALILINGALSVWLRLGLERRLAVASLRAMLQLLLLGYLLVPIFAWQSPLLVLGWCLLMILLAAREAVRRSSRRYAAIQRNTVVALLISATFTAWMAVAVLVGVEPWWEPRYLIPLLGMILGNGVTGISLGLDRCLTELDDGRDRIESMLALGATWWEAARPVAKEALRSAMIPILNTMSVAGLVSIPGMMTGQLLGGTAPDIAARYQILIIFLIASGTAMGASGAILLTLRTLFDDQHRLRTERIRRIRG
jgi:putative ABC transport system permease protein